MTDAISRSALMRSLEEAEQRTLHDGEWPYTASVLAKAIVKVKEFVADLPALDVAPVVHARWIRDDLGNTRCSNCHTRLPFRHCYDDEDDYEWDDEIDETPWCMHCGARMDGEENG